MPNNWISNLCIASNKNAIFKLIVMKTINVNWNEYIWTDDRAFEIINTIVIK